MFRRRPRPPRAEMLRTTPLLNPAVRWTVLDNGRMHVAYQRAGNRATRWFRKAFALAEVSELLLDETGTKVVRCVDGTRTVADLIAYVATEFKLSRKESEIALLKYLDLLGRRNLIAFADPKEPE